jgi:hypothetical protein
LALRTRSPAFDTGFHVLRWPLQSGHVGSSALFVSREKGRGRAAFPRLRVSTLVAASRKRQARNAGDPHKLSVKRPETRNAGLEITRTKPSQRSGRSKPRGVNLNSATYSRSRTSITRIRGFQFHSDTSQGSARASLRFGASLHPGFRRVARIRGLASSRQPAKVKPSASGARGSATAVDPRSLAGLRILRLHPPLGHITHSSPPHTSAGQQLV